MKKLTLTLTLIAVLMMGMMAVIAQDAEEEEELLDCPAFEDSSADVRIGYYMGEGIAYENTGQLSQAIYSYSCIIQQLDDEYVPAYINRALIHTDRRSFDLAIEDYTTLLEIDARLVEAINNRGLVYMARQEYEEALDDFNAVIDTDASYIPGYVNRGVYYAIQSNYELATADFEMVIDLANLNAVLEWYNAPTEDDEGNPIDKGEIPEAETEYARVYAMLGMIDSIEALDDYYDYFRLAEGATDRRIDSATGEMESRLQFDLRFDDGTWVIFDDFIEPEPEEEETE